MLQTFSYISTRKMWRHRPTTQNVLQSKPPHPPAPSNFRSVTWYVQGYSKWLSGLWGCISRCNPMWFLSMGLRQGSGLCSSSSRKYPGTEGTNQNRLQNKHHPKPATPNLQHTTNWEQDDGCGNSTTQSQAPDDGYIDVRNMLST